jgi:flagellar assembly protein FliH
MAAAKFAFDLDFEGGATQRVKAVETLHAEEILRARDAGIAEGFTAGNAAALADIQVQVARTLEVLTNQFIQLEQSIMQVENHAAAQAANLAAVIANRLAAAVLSTRELESVKAFAGQWLEAHMHVSRLVIRVADPLLEAVKTYLDAFAIDHGFSGRLIYLGDPALRAGDCIVEWADGGAERIADMRNQEVETAVATFLATLKGEA